MAHVILSGGTGFIGRRLIAALLEHGHRVRVLVRPESAAKLDPAVEAVSGDPLRAASFASHVPDADTFVHLVGARHPAPWKEQEFRAIDLASLKASADAARDAQIQHFIYLSVAQPAPVMRAYIRVRQEAEAYLAGTGLNRTIIRPWYVLGPGRIAPIVLAPLYWLFERIPATRAGALRLGLVTHEQMTATLVHAVENPASGCRIVETEEIRRCVLDSRSQ
jgi:uncharacterized protein YbjT (DUF2867 family)